MKKYSFEKGYNLIRRCEQADAKKDLMKVLGINTKASWYKRMRGEIMPSIEQYNEVTRIIAAHDVPKCKIWEISDERKSDK